MIVYIVFIYQLVTVRVEGTLSEFLGVSILGQLNHGRRMCSFHISKRKDC